MVLASRCRVRAPAGRHRGAGAVGCVRRPPVAFFAGPAAGGAAAVRGQLGARGLVASLHSVQAIGAATRIGEGDLSSSRFAIWRDTLGLIRAHPWLGVGFGEFNFAWSLTPFPQRPIAFFDHTHNLPLQLAAELGVPLALTVLALLAVALWQAWRRSQAVAAKPAPHCVPPS